MSITSSWPFWLSRRSGLLSVQGFSPASTSFFILGIYCVQSRHPLSSGQRRPFPFPKYPIYFVALGILPSDDMKPPKMSCGLFAPFFMLCPCLKPQVMHPKLVPATATGKVEFLSTKRLFRVSFAVFPTLSGRRSDHQAPVLTIAGRSPCILSPKWRSFHSSPILHQGWSSTWLMSYL